MVETKHRRAPPGPRSRGEVATAASSAPDRHNAGRVAQRGRQAKCDHPAGAGDEETKAATGSDLDAATGIIVAIALSLVVWGGLILFWFVTWLLGTKN